MKVEIVGKVVNCFKGKNGTDVWYGVLVEEGEGRMSIVNMRGNGKREYKMGADVKAVVNARVQFCNEV